jgi:hypothetical protein
MTETTPTRPDGVEEPPTAPRPADGYDDPERVEERERVRLPPDEDPLQQDDPPAPTGDQSHVS